MKLKNYTEKELQQRTGQNLVKANERTLAISTVLFSGQPKSWQPQPSPEKKSALVCS